MFRDNDSFHNRFTEYIWFSINKRRVRRTDPHALQSILFGWPIPLKTYSAEFDIMGQ